MIPQVYNCLIKLGKSKRSRFVVANSSSEASRLIVRYYATLYPHLSFELLHIKPLRSISRQSFVKLKKFINGTLN